VSDSKEELKKIAEGISEQMLKLSSELPDGERLHMLEFLREANVWSASSQVFDPEAENYLNNLEYLDGVKKPKGDWVTVGYAAGETIAEAIANLVVKRKS
jgi:hypothetical protein